MQNDQNNLFKGAIINGHDVDGWIVYNEVCEDYEYLKIHHDILKERKDIVRITIELKIDHG